MTTKTGIDPVLKFGRNPDIDTGTEDVWDGGGTWVAPTAARIHAIVSADAADAAAGTGMRTVSVQGLDANYNLQSETVTLNGTTPVNTVGSYRIVHRMYGLTFGSGGTNAGAITATAATDSTVTAQISAGEGQTLMAIYQVPAGYRANILQYYASAGGIVAAATCVVRLRVKPFGGGYLTKHVLEAVTTGSNLIDYHFCCPLMVDEKSIIKIEATSGAANMIVSAGFNIEFEPILS